MGRRYASSPQHYTIEIGERYTVIKNEDADVDTFIQIGSVTFQNLINIYQKGAGEQDRARAMRMVAMSLIQDAGGTT